MKRKDLMVAVMVSLTSILFWGCGSTASIDTGNDTGMEEPAGGTETEAETETETTEQEGENGEAQNSEGQNGEEAGQEADTPATTTVYLVSKRIYYDADGTETGVTEYEYDDKGNETKMIYNSSDGTTEITTYENEYYSSGNIKQVTVFNEDGSISYQFECDEDGNEIRRYIDDDFMGIKVEWENEYGENGIKISEKDTHYNEHGSISSIYEYEFDEYGNEIKEIWVMYNDDGSEMSSGESEYYYEYNDGHLPVKKTCDHTDGGQSIDEYEYDSNGNVVKEINATYKADGSVFLYSTYEHAYDEYGNETKYASYEQDGSIGYYFGTEYTYDSDHNITKVINCDEDGTIRSSYEQEFIEMQIPVAE